MKRTVKVNEAGLRIGEDHHNAKLTDHECSMLQYMHEVEGWGYGKLAKAFDISKSQARNIIKGIKRAQSCAGHREVTT